jgi:lysophospholipase L1-like esterase
MRRFSALYVMAGLIVACGSIPEWKGDGIVGDDAGSKPNDGGRSADAGTGADAGWPADAGSADAGDAFNPCPSTTATACKVMPLGDSITDGASVPGGYRLELFRQSGPDKKALTFVGSLSNGPAAIDGRQFPQRHEGHSGYTIDTIGGRNGIYPLIAQALTTHQPHIVLLMIGTNDVGISADLANAPKRLGLLLDRITSTSPSALLVVAKIVPTTDDAMNKRVQSYNEGVAQVVNQRISAGKHLVLVDMYKAFSDNPNFESQWMADSLHPTAAGYAAMAKVWYPAIERFLPASP